MPNQDGKELPIFYMLCTKQKRQSHQGIALKLVLNTVLLLLRGIRACVIVIDKDKTSLNSINVVESDDHCWSIEYRVMITVGALRIG